MRLTRPVSLGLLVLVGLLLVWLVVSQGTAEEPSGAEQSATQESASQDPTSPEPSQADPASTPTPSPEDTAYPVGVDTRDWDDIDACRDDLLPEELVEVVDDIEVGGPYDYPGKDGSTFGNYEGYLPDEGRGYYREFTVETPGLDHRGARRVVTGGGELDPEVWYYTQDHYESFCEFAP